VHRYLGCQYRRLDPHRRDHKPGAPDPGQPSKYFPHQSFWTRRDYGSDYGLGQQQCKKPTLTEAENLSQAQDVATRYTLAFSSLTPTVDPNMDPSVAPATLDAGFVKILNTSKTQTPYESSRSLSESSFAA
jgi:hypothetical protein